MKIPKWLAAAATFSLLFGCAHAGTSSQGGNMAGFAGRKPGITQSTQTNFQAKQLSIRIVRHTDVMSTGHHTPTLDYDAHRVTVPMGWTVQVNAEDDHRRPLGVSIVPGDQNTDRQLYTNIGTKVRFEQPGEYLVLSSVSGVHGSVLDYITVSRTATTPSISPE